MSSLYKGKLYSKRIAQDKGNWEGSRKWENFAVLNMQVGGGNAEKTLFEQYLKEVRELPMHLCMDLEERPFQAEGTASKKALQCEHER